MKPNLVARRCINFLLLILIATLPNAALALTASQVYERVKDSVVVVKTYNRAGKMVGLGSGVMLPSQEIITNYHVVKEGVSYTVGQRGQTVKASLKGSDPDKDLSLLLAPGLTATPARQGQASRLKVGEKVFAVGAPQGLELSLSEGIVSQLRGGPPPIIQTTVAISQGSSGGGLFNAEGELVGITTFYVEGGQSLNFALPVELVRELASSPKRATKPTIIGWADEQPQDQNGGKRSEGVWDDRARALVKANNWKNLLAHCRQWTRTQPYSADAWFYLGVAYGKLGRYREEIEPYQEALRLKPNYDSAWYNLGLAYGQLGRNKEAIEAFRESVRLRPDDADARGNLGIAYDHSGRYREALRLRPHDAFAWRCLAVAYARSGNPSAALEAVKELRKYNPQGADELFNKIIKP